VPKLHYSRATTGEKVGPGPVIVETWGEDPDPYLAAGFELTERNGGWELILPG
jgi:hypothetical protein